MYAIIELGGRQWKIEPGTRLEINRVDGKIGGQITIERVLLVHDGKQAHLGAPFLKDAKVICEVVSHDKGPKVITYKFRRRENWRKTVGHRQSLTRLVVKTISVAGVSFEAEEQPKAQPKPKAASASDKPEPKRARVTAVKPRLGEGKTAHKAEHKPDHAADVKKSSASKTTKHPKK